MAPRAIGLGATQITFLVVTGLATGLGLGAVTAFTYAFTLLQIPIGVIGVPLGVVLFPSLSREVATGNRAEFVGLLTRALRFLTVLMLPIAVVGAILSVEIVAVLFGGFERSVIELTADTLRRVPDRARRARPDRGAGPGVLRAPRHAHARGDGGDGRRHQHDPRRGPGRPARPARHRPRHRDRRLARGDAPAAPAAPPGRSARIRGGLLARAAGPPGDGDRGPGGSRRPRQGRPPCWPRTRPPVDSRTCPA